MLITGDLTNINQAATIVVAGSGMRDILSGAYGSINKKLIMKWKKTHTTLSIHQ